MSYAETVALGTIAGLTIFLGLPIARLRMLSVKHLAFLNAFAIGVLFFLFVDIIHHAAEPVEAAIRAGGTSGIWPVLAALIGGFLIGLLSLVYYGRRALAGGAHVPQRLAMLIATGLGLHNFSEGLAIGASAQKGEIALAFTLVVGFGLHNFTEAFGIVGPLAGQRASWEVPTSSERRSGTASRPTRCRCCSSRWRVARWSSSSASSSRPGASSPSRSGTGGASASGSSPACSPTSCSSPQAASAQHVLRTRVLVW